MLKISRLAVLKDQLCFELSKNILERKHCSISGLKVKLLCSCLSLILFLKAENLTS